MNWIRFSHFFKIPSFIRVISPFNFFHDPFCLSFFSVTTEARAMLFGFSERPKAVVVHIGSIFDLGVPWKKLARGWKKGSHFVCKKVKIYQKLRIFSIDICIRKLFSFMRCTSWKKFQGHVIKDQGHRNVWNFKI